MSRYIFFAPEYELNWYDDEPSFGSVSIAGMTISKGFSTLEEAEQAATTYLANEVGGWVFQEVFAEHECVTSDEQQVTASLVKSSIFVNQTYVETSKGVIDKTDLYHNALPQYEFFGAKKQETPKPLTLHVEFYKV